MIIKTIQASVFRVPIEKPLKASFGEMRNRPAVLIRAEADDGTVGWGETWCNFPTVGAEHRAHLINETVAPLIINRAFADPRIAFEQVTQILHVLAIQAGEPGPIAQAIAGVDIALWDVLARQRGEPLYATLGDVFGTQRGAHSGSLPCYASGLGPESPEQQAKQARDEGHLAFKLKVGFDQTTDLANLAAMRRELGSEAKIALDANQRWSVQAAIDNGSRLSEYAPLWLEEPLPADRSDQEWDDLAQAISIPLAAGENLRGSQLNRAISKGYLDFVQPDIAKWGGFTAGYPMTQTILAAGRSFCPHYLGGGIGLMASAHLLAAAGGPGLLEVDYNPNPLRTLLAEPFPVISGGHFHLSEKPGLGVDPQLDELGGYQTL